MVESVRDYAILALDREGRVISWNTGAERIEGYRTEEILGRHFSRFYQAEDVAQGKPEWELERAAREGDRKSTRLNSSHLVISYAVFCLKKKKVNSQAKGLYT